MAERYLQRSALCARISAPAICTRRELCSIVWVSPSRLVTRDIYGHTTLWSLDARTCIQRQQQESDGALSLVSADRLISATYGAIELWSVDPAQDHLVYTAPGAQRFAHDRVIHAANGVIVAAQDDDLVVLCLDGDRLTELRRLPRLGALLTSGSMPRYECDSSHLSADGSALGSSLARAIRVCSLKDDEVHHIKGCDQLLALDATGQRVFIKNSFEHGRIISLPDGATLHTIPRSIDAWLARFMGEALVFVYGDATLCLYDLISSALIWRRTFDAPIKHLACSPDGRHIALGFVHRVLILDAQTGELAQDGGPQGEIRRLACVERPAQIVASSHRKAWDAPTTAHRWSLADGAYLGELALQYEAVQADAIHGQSPSVFAERARTGIVRWPAADAASAQVLLPDTSRIMFDMAITQDGQRLVRDAFIMNPKGTKAVGWGLYLLDLQQTPPGDTLLFSVKRPPNKPAIYASASRYAALASDRDTIEVFDLAAAQPLHTLKGAGKDGVEQAAFSPDEGSLVAVSGAKIKRWSLADGEPVWESKHLECNPEYTVCVSPDGRYVVSAGRYHAWITLRSMQTGAIVAQLHQDAVEGITALAFGPDDRLYAAGLDTQLYVIDLPADL